MKAEIIRHSLPTIGREEIKAVNKTILSLNLSTQRIVDRFERKISKIAGVKYAVATNSGTSSLYLILMFLPKIFPEMRNKRYVIVPSFACPAITNALFTAGYNPIFADINLENFSLDIEDVRKKMNKEVACIVYIHSFGICSELPMDLPFVEGIAQSFGGMVNGKHVGSQSIASFSSFYATKVITTGEGGAVFSNSKELIEMIKDFIEYDKKEYYKDKFRFNFKMSDINASLGLAQLRKLKKFLGIRKKLAKIYFDELKELELKGLIRLPPQKENIFYRFPIISEVSGDKLISFLREKKIMAEKLIYKPLHWFYQPEIKLEKTEIAYMKGVSLPIYPSLREEDIEKICFFVKNFFKSI